MRDDAEQDEHANGDDNEQDADGDDAGGTIAHPPEGRQEESIESEETLSPDEVGGE